MGAYSIVVNYAVFLCKDYPRWYRPPAFEASKYTRTDTLVILESLRVERVKLYIPTISRSSEPAPERSSFKRLAG